MSLGTMVRDRRLELGMTQDKVATLVDISKPYLSNIETGRAPNPPSDKVLRALEKALKFQTGTLTTLGHREKTPLDVRQGVETLEAEVAKLRAVLRKFLAHSGRRAPGGLDLGDIAESVEKEGKLKNASPQGMVPVINRVTAGYPAHFTDLDYPAGIADEYIRCPDLHDPQAFAARVVGDSMEPEYHEGDIVVFSPNTAARNGDDCFVRFDADGGTTFKRSYQDNEQTVRLQPLNSKYPAEVYGREKTNGLWPAVFLIRKLRRD